MLHRAGEEFAEHGYVHTTLRSITDASRATRGSLYFHFASKQNLARAVIDEGLARFQSACAQPLRAHNRAVEALIEFTYALAGYGHGDPAIRAAFRLVLEIGDYRGTDRLSIFDTWTAQCRHLLNQAIAEGDLHEDADPYELGPLLVQIAYGVRLQTTDKATDLLPHPMTVAWQLLLPALTDPANAQYLRQFAARRVVSVPVHGNGDPAGHRSGHGHRPPEPKKSPPYPVSSPLSS
ncbi:TetR/AcrR family transcriptional regulator [Rhodococcus opacus]|uniref:TetR/AcrR family transcriptional regulator n=1 Tax=Rhodococcus opacus TaxID=37919 RepID=UPI002235CE19|nr:TetR/AcrR family transcriptional regulator [Rhodococcus opacus]UZG59622.1 TetR/AcrR family transcriptional regulator [Rhodococcus opacus]